MPTYDYVCEHCDHKWELFQSIKANPIRKCPQCGKQKARRVIGPGAGIIFRGSGFYQTDYRSEAYKKAAQADQKAASPDGQKSEKSEKGEKSSGESKPASDQKKSTGDK